MENMDILRQQIQDIDTQLVDLIGQRIEIATKIGKIKAEKGLPIYAPDVEKRKIEQLAAIAPYAGMVECIWPVIMCYTRTCE